MDISDPPSKLIRLQKLLLRHLKQEQARQKSLHIFADKIAQTYKAARKTKTAATKIAKSYKNN